ncbi:MAG TPA: CoA-binding protein, partial [Burkholderiales bacterium]|nr:CoA-binding protein [Burkholderiales bacterium]
MQRPPAASTATDFDRLINPRSVAIVGASSNPTSIGGQPLRFLTEFGYQGKVYPVNPRYPELKGLACYPDIGAVPRPCDVALIAVGAAQVPKVIEQCGAAGIPFAIVMSAGFREIGAAGMGLQRELEAALARTTLRMVGPNCIGMMNVRDHIHCGFGGAMSNSRMRAGGLAMVTQSGGFGLGVVAAADQAGLGFNYVISTGNETDVGALELVANLVERDDVEAVVAYLEGSTDGRRLRAIGERALEKRKPVLMWKVGNSGSGRRAAVSHTGRLTADATLFRRALA